MYKETQARSSGGIEAADTTEMRDRARESSSLKRETEHLWLWQTGGKATGW